MWGEVKMKEFWINFYKDGLYGPPHSTREKAKAASINKNAIAYRIHVRMK